MLQQQSTAVYLATSWWAVKHLAATELHISPTDGQTRTASEWWCCSLSGCVNRQVFAASFLYSIILKHISILCRQLFCSKNKQSQFRLPWSLCFNYLHSCLDVRRNGPHKIRIQHFYRANLFPCTPSRLYYCSAPLPKLCTNAGYYFSVQMFHVQRKNCITRSTCVFAAMSKKICLAISLTVTLPRLNAAHSLCWIKTCIRTWFSHFNKMRAYQSADGADVESCSQWAAPPQYI